MPSSGMGDILLLGSLDPWTEKCGERGKPELSKKGRFVPWNLELKLQVNTGSTNVSNMKYIYYTSTCTDVYEKYDSDFIAIVYFNVNV